MKSKKYQFVPRKESIQNKFNIFIDRKHSNSKDKYRNSVATDMRYYQPQTHRIQNQKRFSMNVNSYAPNLKLQENNKSYQTMQSIKNTLSLLQSRINSAKQQLNGRRILGKSIIYQESQESRLNQSNSMNQSQKLGSNEQEKKHYFNQKQQQFNRIIQIAELTKIKSYYKCELAKILINNNEKLAKYFIDFWKSIKKLQNIQYKTQTTMIRQLSEIPINKKILVLGLDDTIIHCQKDRKSQDDIDITIADQKGQKKEIYVSIRPYAISFLKKMSKKFTITIFSTKSKKQTDAILDEIDPLAQFIHHRLYRHNCIEYPQSILIKNLQLFNRDLSTIVLIDSIASIYVPQINNLIPIIPYLGGNDSQLYSLQKYLEPIAKMKDIRVYNSNYFQLQKYVYYDDGIEALKNIYFTRH